MSRTILLSWFVRHLALCAHLGLEGVEEHLKVALLHELWWFLSVLVSVEVAQLLLNFTERVDELFVAENSGDRFDRGEEIAGERLVVVDHLVNVYLGLDHLGNSLVLSDFLFQL